MSSHHFVKEQQEPALLILEVSSISYDSISPLLEWSPTVLVAEAAMDTVLSWGFKIDVMLASESYQSAHIHLLEEQYPVKFLTVKEGQFLEEGLQYLIASKHGAVNVVGYDHTKVFELEPKTDLIDLVIIDGPLRYFPVKNGSFKKRYADVSLQLHAPEDTMVEVKTEGNSQFIKVNHATFVEVEGNVYFHSPEVFWIGEFLV